MKILVVKYLPSGESSNTLQLLEDFKGKISSLHKIEEVDLIKTPPKYFDELVMQAYKKRNFGGMELDVSEAEAIKPMDDLLEQFKKADLVVLATPMHNFSLPGLVKLYFDSIMQNGKVVKYVDGSPVGQLTNIKFLTLYTSSGSYHDEYGFMDTLKTIVKIELGFMGINEFDFVHASTGNPTTKDNHMENAKKAVDTVVSKWKL